MMNGEAGRNLAEVGKATGVAVIFCLLATLLFAFIIKIAELPSEVILPVNRVIRAAAVFLGCIVGLSDNKGLVKGIISGVLTFILTYLLFSLLGGGFRFSWSVLLECLFSLLAGGISGVIAVNIHK